MSVYLHLPYSETRKLRGFKKIIRHILKNARRDRPGYLQHILNLGCENGFCHAETRELIRDCQRELIIAVPGAA
ncbi:hypothetical protein AB9P05_16320 [Roseivirga sp. BDSF3-8]|uniref:hypothetical protein n=1 Tax=Roseivirga sp. BDSF3-8 TaxID=3241598 RepID=UPI00353259CF